MEQLNKFCFRNCLRFVNIWGCHILFHNSFKHNSATQSELSPYKRPTSILYNTSTVNLALQTVNRVYQVTVCQTQASVIGDFYPNTTIFRTVSLSLPTIDNYETIFFNTTHTKIMLQIYIYYPTNSGWTVDKVRYNLTAILFVISVI